MIADLLLLIVIVVLLAAALATIISHSSTANGRPSRGGRPPLPPTVAIPLNDRASATAKYRPRNGIGDYLFRFEEIAPGYFKVYVLQQPSHGEQNLGAIPHLLSDANGLYICWTVPITSYEDAKEIAARWAEAVEEFRETGKGF